jgi:drug/metabolite transporter (DMT)-like permease
MKKRAILFIVIAGVMWGTSGLFSHVFGLYGYTALQKTAVRGSVAFLCMLAFVLIRHREAFRIKLRDLWLYVGIGAGLFGAAAAYYAAMVMTSESTAVVLMYTSPIYVLIFSVLFFGERLTPLKLLGIGGMLLGCCFVSGIFEGFSGNVAGILMGLLAGVSYGAYNIFTKIALRRSCKPMSTTLYGFMGMAILAVCTSDPAGIFPKMMQRPGLLIPLSIALGVVTYVVPYFLYTLALRDLPAGTASALGIIEPMSATLFAFFLLEGNEPSVLSVIGIVLILGCVLLLSRPEPEKKEKVNASN